MEDNKIDLYGLLKSMTLKEKIGQLLQLAPFFFRENLLGEITGPMHNLGITNEDINNAGSVLGIGGAKELRDIQSHYLEKHDKKIPLIFMADIIHGYRTIFPIPLAIGCSWDLEAAEKVARVSAVEASAGGVHVTFSPMVDLVRDPRWGRVMESTGEDPFLNSLYARAFVRGYQGNDISKDGNIASCVKHFAAYGAAEAGRDYNTVDLSERLLRENYLKAYHAAIDEGAKMIMTSFNIVNSQPATGNEWLLRDVLRKEWGFEGVTISDYSSVKEMIKHGYAEDSKEAAEKAIRAGLDIEMMSSCYTKYLEELLNEGKINMEIIDEAVLRILKLKEEVGLFENPYKGADEEKEKTLFLSNEHRQAAREMAQKSIVLLKNDHEVLPFSKNVGKVAIVGPFADEHAILGPWSWGGRFEESISLKDGIYSKIGADHVIVAKGTGIENGNDFEMEEAIRIADSADVVIVAIGEHHNMSGEGGSRGFITLPGRQEEFVNKILALRKPTAVVLFNGRPLEIRNLTNSAPAIVEAWFPGTEGGNALADILFGDVNPSGKLTMSFPYTVGQIPVYYNAFNTGRPNWTDNLHDRFSSHFIDIPNSPLFPFGYGLSYSKFYYSYLNIDQTTLTRDGSITVNVKVKNTSKVPGTEIVQLYIRDLFGSVVRPVKELKGFKRIYLNPNEEQLVEFTITEEMLRFYNNKMEFKSEKGKFEAMIGPNSKDVQSIEFELI